MKAASSNVFPAVTTQMRRDQSLDLEATTRDTERLGTEWVRVPRPPLPVRWRR